MGTREFPWEPTETHGTATGTHRTHTGTHGTSNGNYGMPWVTPIVPAGSHGNSLEPAIPATSACPEGAGGKSKIKVQCPVWCGVLFNSLYYVLCNGTYIRQNVHLPLSHHKCFSTSTLRRPAWPCFGVKKIGLARCITTTTTTPTLLSSYL